MYRKTRSTEHITLEYIDAKFDKHMEQMRQDRKEMIAATEARLAADRKEAEARQQATETRLENERKEAEARQQATETRLENERKEAEARLAADRKETAERLAADRKEAEARQQATETRLMDERKEFITQKRWLIANFLAIVVGMASIFIAVLIAIVVIVNGGLTV